MSPQEYVGWERHLLRFPHGDFHAQKILAEIWAAIASVFDGNPHSFLEVAPWLENPDARADRVAEEERAAKASLTQRVTDAYQRSKERGGAD